MLLPASTGEGLAEMATLTSACDETATGAAVACTPGEGKLSDVYLTLSVTLGPLKPELTCSTRVKVSVSPAGRFAAVHWTVPGLPGAGFFWTNWVGSPAFCEADT